MRQRQVEVPITAVLWTLPFRYYSLSFCLSLFLSALSGDVSGQRTCARVRLLNRVNKLSDCRAQSSNPSMVSTSSNPASTGFPIPP